MGEKNLQVDRRPRKKKNLITLWRAGQTHNTRKHREPSIESGPSSTILAHRVSTQGALSPVDTAAGREPPQDFLASQAVRMSSELVGVRMKFVRSSYELNLFVV